MSDDANTGANSGRRRRRSRRRGRGGGGGGNSGGGGNNGGNSNPGNQAQPRPQRKRQSKTPEHKFGGRNPVAVEEWNSPNELNTFELFCSYHLGLFENNDYRDPSIKQVARLFGRSIDDIRRALDVTGLDDATVKATGYDVSLARLDLKVAPDGIDKRELAKNLYEEFRLEHPSLDTDWSESQDDDSEE